MEKTKHEVEVDVRPTGIQSAVVYAPFDEALETLTENGYRIISLEENAQLRIQQGANSPVSTRGNWTREGVLYVPKKGAFLTKNSPIMKNPREATRAHRNGIEYSLIDEQVEEALQDSVKLSGKEILTNRFGENDITAYAFGEIAEDYGIFLRDAGIKEIPVYLTNVSDQPFARQMCFGDLDYGSGLNGNYRGLNVGGGVRGVLKDTEGVAPKNK